MKGREKRSAYQNGVEEASMMGKPVPVAGKNLQEEDGILKQKGEGGGNAQKEPQGKRREVVAGGQCIAQRRWAITHELAHTG